MTTQEHRAGVVALVGPPNAGKSTLLNALVGQKLAIVSPKPQTTRSRILGIRTRPEGQIVLVDTPGLHASAKLLNSVLNAAVDEAARGADLALVLVDRTRGWTPEHDAVAALLREARVPALLVGTKVDLERRPPSESWPPDVGLDFVAHLDVSSTARSGIDELERAILRALPDSPALYGEDELTDRPLRWLAGELVREALFAELEHELPYEIATEVIEYDESRPDLVRIRANLLVARSSQKRIVVGSGGEQIKRIGMRARRQIEELVGSQVHLELWVKVEPRWLKNPSRLEELGYG